MRLGAFVENPENPSTASDEEFARLGGKIGGRSRSAAKVAAARTNGKRGGRPKGAKNKPKT